MPHLTRSSTTERIEPDLAGLWRDVVRQGPVARAVMSNLIVFRQCGDDAGTAGDAAAAARLEEVVAQHPCRLIVLDHQRHPPREDEPFAVDVGVLVFGPERARYGIERIAVRSACAEVQLPSIVRHVVRGDVPTSVWWMEDLSRVPPLDAIVGMGRQILYDSRSWRDLKRGMRVAAALIASRRRLDVADLNWRRLTPLRQALLHACAFVPIDDICRGPLRIVHRPEDGALAWLYAGWLRSRRSMAAGVQLAIEAGQRDDAFLVVESGAGETRITARLDDHQVVMTLPGDAPPLTVSVPRENEAHAVAAELRTLSHDAALHEAIANAALLLD
jgi:glucose-6-phosphate dehydrogenase assembly protein OpcA